MKALFSLFFFLFPIAFSSLAQQNLEYTPDFVFKEGVYLSFEDFKNNNPIALTHILSDFDIRSTDYVWQVLNTDSITYFDNLFEERIAPVNKVWGFCSNNKIHVGINTVERSERWNDRDWFQLISIGAYSYFTAVILVERFMPPNQGMMMPGGGMSMNDPMLNRQMSSYEESVSIQMLLDFPNGEFIQLAFGDLNSISPKLMSVLLQNDASLQREYLNQSARDQKKISMFYIRKFNQRSPIYFPQ
jgi:hypothetical protein